MGRARRDNVTHLGLDVHKDAIAGAILRGTRAFPRSGSSRTRRSSSPTRRHSRPEPWQLSGGFRGDSVSHRRELSAQGEKGQSPADTPQYLERRDRPEQHGNRSPRSAIRLRRFARKGHPARGNHRLERTGASAADARRRIAAPTYETKPISADGLDGCVHSCHHKLLPKALDCRVHQLGVTEPLAPARFRRAQRTFGLAQVPPRA